MRGDERGLEALPFCPHFSAPTPNGAPPQMIMAITGHKTEAVVSE